MKQKIHTGNAPAPVGPYSQAIRKGNLLFVSGQIALDPQSGVLVNSSIEQETEQVMHNLEAILTAASATLDHVVKCSVFVKDIGNYDRINSVYQKYFAHSEPARELVEVARLPKDANVEISCIAILEE